MILSKFIRYGRYSGKLYVFTNWDPETNMVWSDDIPNKKNEPDGRWVNMDNVRWK